MALRAILSGVSERRAGAKNMPDSIGYHTAVRFGAKETGSGGGREDVCADSLPSLHDRTLGNGIYMEV